MRFDIAHQVDKIKTYQQIQKEKFELRNNVPWNPIAAREQLKVQNSVLPLTTSSPPPHSPPPPLTTILVQ